jgi:hypothetical protein
VYRPKGVYYYFSIFRKIKLCFLDHFIWGCHIARFLVWLVVFCCWLVKLSFRVFLDHPYIYWVFRSTLISPPSWIFCQNSNEIVFSGQKSIRNGIIPAHGLTILTTPNTDYQSVNKEIKYGACRVDWGEFHTVFFWNTAKIRVFKINQKYERRLILTYIFSHFFCFRRFIQNFFFNNFFKIKKVWNFEFSKFIENYNK